MSRTSKSRAQGPQPAVPSQGPRIAVCRFPAVINVNGARRSYSLTAGAQVDLDEVIGHCDGEPLTLASALGPHAVHFELLSPASAEPVASPAPVAIDSEE